MYNFRHNHIITRPIAFCLVLYLRNKYILVHVKEHQYSVGILQLVFQKVIAVVIIR
jgi:hypothetical protein